MYLIWTVNINYFISMARDLQGKQGFSLIQVSVLIAVGGIIVASLIPAGETGNTIDKDRITREKMDKIEAATQSFMAANLRRPCPADGTLATNSANFGMEANNNGRCSGGAIQANFTTESSPITVAGTTTLNSATVTAISSTSGLSVGLLVTGTNIASDTHILSIDSDTQITLDKYATGAAVGTIFTFSSVAAGVVPVRTLGLPDDYMFDGYGRRIGYMVDIRATDKTTCRNMQTTKTLGSIQIMDSSAATSPYDLVMWSLISHGKNGHGAFPMQGSSIANRLRYGTSLDERVNAFVDSGFSTVFTRNLIRHEPTTSTTGASYFDDITWTQESTKNTCCTGKMCNMGTRIDGVASEYLGPNATTGDINGDGIQDIIVYKAGVNKIRVIFGSATGWGVNSGLNLSTTNKNRFFTITNTSSPSTYQNFAGGLAVGDINGDDFDDIVIGYGNSTNSYVSVYYGSAAVSTLGTVDIHSYTSARTAYTIKFPVRHDDDAPPVVLGYFAHLKTSKIKDIFVLISDDSGHMEPLAYVIYGQSSYGSPMTAEAFATSAGSVGFKIYHDDGVYNHRFNSISFANDLNNDGYDELIINDRDEDDLHLLFGRSITDWQSAATAPSGSTPSIINLGSVSHTLFTNGSSDVGEYTAKSGKLNNDDINDLIFNNGNYFYVYYGKSSAWSSSVNLSTASNYNGTNGFRIDINTSKPSWVTGTINKAFLDDINNDGKTDITITDNSAGPNSKAGSGSSFVMLQPAAGWSSIWTSGTINFFTNSFNSSGLPLNNDTSKAFRIDGSTANDASQLLCIADINNDGTKDLLFGSPNHNSNAGALYILFGKKFTSWDSYNSLNLLE